MLEQIISHYIIVSCSCLVEAHNRVSAIECLQNAIFFLFFLLNNFFLFVLILDCYIEDEGAMKLNASVFCLKENRVWVTCVKLDVMSL